MNKEGELIINNKDAWTQWGVFLSDKGLSALMSPVPLKDTVSNKSVTEHGRQTRVEQSPKVDERSVTLSLSICATGRDDLLTKMAGFYEELRGRRLNITTKYQQGVVYRMDYQSCTQYTTFLRGIANYSLKLTEPNPANRGVENIENNEDSTD